MQMQELEIFRIFGEEKAFLTESIKTLNGKSCSPQVITATIGSFICGNSFFVHGQEEKKKGRGWFEIYGSSCAPSQILAFHLTGAVETKVLRTLTFQPGCFIVGPTGGVGADYWELFGFPLLDGFLPGTTA